MAALREAEEARKSVTTLSTKWTLDMKAMEDRGVESVAHSRSFSLPLTSATHSQLEAVALVTQSLSNPCLCFAVVTPLWVGGWVGGWMTSSASCCCFDRVPRPAGEAVPGEGTSGG